MDRQASIVIRRAFSSSTIIRNARDAPPLPSSSSASIASSSKREADVGRYNPDQTAEIPHKYQYPDVPANVEHPSYSPTEIMDFRDKSAKYPPALAVKRFDKLKQAKQLGIHHTNFNKTKREQAPLPSVPVRVDRRAKDEKVQYQVGKVGVTNERRAYYEDLLGLEGEQGGSAASSMASPAEMEWEAEDVDMAQLQIGRIVEVRR